MCTLNYINNKKTPHRFLLSVGRFLIIIQLNSPQHPVVFAVNLDLLQVYSTFFNQIVVYFPVQVASGVPRWEVFVSYIDDGFAHLLRELELCIDFKIYAISGSSETNPTPHPALNLPFKRFPNANGIH